MHITDYELTSVQFAEKGFWIGAVKFTCFRDGFPYPDNFDIRIRFTGDKSQSYSEVEAQFLEQAKNVLLQAGKVLASETPDTLQQSNADRASKL